MTLPYAYTPSIWFVIVSILWMGFLTWYGWQKRSLPWAIPFAALTGTAALWILGSGFETAATEISTKIDWFMFKKTASIPLAVAELWFVLEYAGLRQWATHRHLALLLSPLILQIVLAVSNNHHHLLWKRFWLDGTIRAALGPLGTIFTGYSLVLFLLSMLVIMALFIRWSLHRWPIGLLLMGQLVIRVVYLLENTTQIVVASINLSILSADFAALFVAFAIFRFHFFSLLPIGREMIIERMTDGILVLDARNRVADLNPAAEKMLGYRRSALIGQPLTEALAGFPALLQYITQPTALETIEIQVGNEDPPAWYQVSLTPITGTTDFLYGQLLILHDISKLKHTQQRLIQEQRALAALREQEWLARELHDELSQELAFINLQAQAVKELLAAGQTVKIDTYLARLTEVAREAHANIRSMISGLMVVPTHNLSEALRTLVQTFTRRYGVPVEFIASDNQLIVHLEPAAEVQLLRIVQEALTNARKHAQAQHIRVHLTTDSSGIVVIVEDDGIGFDTTQMTKGGTTFGLQIMRERTEDIGGVLEISSSEGHGTCIMVHLPAAPER